MHIVISTDESFITKNHLQTDTIKCFCDKNGLQFHMFSVNKTRRCKHFSVFYRRHCILAEIMKNWNENDFVYAIDSDVISYKESSRNLQNPNENIDLIFFERWWNGEVMSGKYTYHFLICFGLVWFG